MTDAATAIQNLVFRYAELIDLGDFDGLADLLGGAAIGSGDTGPTLTGHDAVLAMFTSTTRRYPDGTPGTKHVTTNFIVEVDEQAGTAATRSYFTVLQAVRACRCSRSWPAGTTTGSVRGRVMALRRAPVLHRPGRRPEPPPARPLPATGS